MRIDFWFDPACPFCWATSRWINRVRPHRDLEIDWLPISLLFKNEITDPTHPFYERVSRSRDLLRVVVAAREAGHEDRISDLYTEYGRHIHHRGEMDFDVAAVLGRVGLDPTLADALTDESLDDSIRASMADGLGLTGADVGTPLIAAQTQHGRRGLFGPVITEVPDEPHALALWDGFVAMLEVPGFFELKRTRTDAPTLVLESVLDEQLDG